MVMELAKGLLKRSKMKRLRRVLQGYRMLKKSNSLRRINDVKDMLTTTECCKGGSFSKFIFGAATGNAELVLRQYLLLRVANLDLNKALLYALGKPGSAVVYPLPSEWRKVLEPQGFKVAKIRSALMWDGYIVLLLAYGILSIGRIVFHSIKEIIRPSFPALGSYAYFDTLTAGNLPEPCKDGRSHDIVTWYQQWLGRVRELDSLCHSVKDVTPSTVEGIPVVSVSSAIPPLTQLGALIRYVGWGTAASMLGIVDLFRGRWWHALLLNQAALAAQVRMHKVNELARDYLFHISSWVYRPLWTYDAEKLGSRITFYFYGTNTEDFKRSDGYRPPAYGWRAVTWSHYLVWDEYQAGFVRRAHGGANISVVGPILFQSSAIEMPKIEKPGVAVFDVTPLRKSFCCISGIDFDYYVPATNEKFLEHIANVTRQLDAIMLWKLKREIGDFVHPHYRHFAGRFSERVDVVSLDPGISTVRVIESSCAVISMPFTSTALLAKAMGKPSIYYDPTGRLQPDDRAAHGIPVLVGPEELKTWISPLIDIR